MKAFPRPYSSLDGLKFEAQEGMDMRDYFAAHALPGIIALNIRDNAKEDCELAYEYADKMLKAREK